MPPRSIRYAIVGTGMMGHEHMRFLERLAAGDVGRLHMLSIRKHRFAFLPKVGHWNRFSANTGGTLVEKCRRPFDLMRLIAGAEALRVFATGGQAVNHLDES